ncbi:Ger(x)C family spore germination protein [Paenibacillus aestuarii]|uniref:Ger(X)C family spore germination protein n=1 Tax=Paenibacillus aestuarii TaxID=516965 RepID=A0ABW0KGR7_9BACL|nr:Ger(x)C family spore germination protein [Paenibacillus aestuarii]
MQVLKSILIFTMAALLLSGCWDKLELEEQAYVVVLGLDLAEKNLVNVTFQIANPQVGSTDKGNAPNEPPSDTLTFTAPDILSAKELANSVVTRKISFAHLRTLVIGEELAKTKLLPNIIVAALRDPEMRREINVIVSHEKSVTFIHHNKPKLETRPHKYYAFMQKRWRDTGHVPYATINRFMQRVHEELFLTIYGTTNRVAAKEKKDEDDYIAGEIPQISGDPVQIMGSAVLKDGVMIGKLTGEETRHVLLLRRKALSHVFVSSYPDPLDNKYRVTVRLLKSSNTQIQINVKKDPPVIHVKVPIKAQVLSIPSLNNYVTDEGNQRLLTKAISNDLKEISTRLIQKTQQEYRAEPFVWFLDARKQFATLQAFEAYEWEKKYADAKVTVDFDVKIESFGKQMDPQHMEQKE